VRYWSKTAIFSYPAFVVPVGGPHQNIVILCYVEKLKWCGYRMVKKFEDRFSCFDRISACDRQMNRQTDRWTDILRYA